MTKKVNENLTKSEALSYAWKNRKDFKGYDKSRGSAYNSWRSIVYTAKGRGIGFPIEWKDFSSFVRDVSGIWSIGKIVRRFDTSLPHGVGNSFWGEKGEENNGRLVTLDYCGETKTLIEWSSELNLNYNGVRQRFFRGKNLSAQEILFGKNKKIRTKRDRGFVFRTNRMLGAYRLRDKRRGLDNDITIEFLREQISHGCFYCGDMDGVGLDRIDNDKGHVKNNVVPCCYECNCARNKNFSFEEMKIIGSSIKYIKRLRREKDCQA